MMYHESTVDAIPRTINLALMLDLLMLMFRFDCAFLSFLYLVLLNQCPSSGP